MRKIILTLSILFIAFLATAAIAFADEDEDIDGGTYAGVQWRVTSDYELLIGKEGETQAFNDTWKPYPWQSDDSLKYYIKSIRFLGTVKGNPYMDGIFEDFSDLTSVDLTGLDTSSTVDMSYMFSGCVSLEELDLSTAGFDTSSVTAMTGMFSRCSSLKHLNLSTFNTRKVNSIESMFYGCSSLEHLDLSSFQLSAADPDQDFVFAGGFNAKTIKVPTLHSSWINLPYAMYDYTGKQYTKLPDDVIRSFTIYKDRDAAISAGSDVSDVSGVCDGVDWRIDENDYLVIGKEGQVQEFDYRSSRTSDEEITDTPYYYPWDIYCYWVKGVRFEGTVKGNGGMESMFYGIGGEIDLDGFDTSLITNMAFMFKCCSAESLNLSGFDTSGVTDMSGMFYGCTELKTLDLSGFDTSNVTDMRRMFDACTMLKTVNLSSFDTSRVTDMTCMFSGCWTINKLDLSAFRTDSLEYWGGMFEDCSNLMTLNISQFDTRSCKAEWDGEKLPVFQECDSLKYIALGANTLSKESLYKTGWVRYKKLNGETVSAPYIKNLSGYTGKSPGWYKYIVKKKNPMRVNTYVRNVKAKRLTRARIVSPIKVTNNKGTVRHEKVSGSKELTLNKKNGKVTVKKKTKRGKYRMRVMVYAEGNHYYYSKAQIVTIRVRVR